MNKTQKLLSDIIIYNKYAKYDYTNKRRETWEEIVTRYLSMMVKKYPDLTNEIMSHGQYLYQKSVLPSMRAAQFAGPAIEKNETRIYNCGFLPVDHYKSFAEVMFLLLGGTGVGYSVQYHHIDKLPEIHKPTKEAKYLVNDSIEGWADAVKQLTKAYFGITKVKPRFDFSDIRPKGSRLITAGGKAPGPDPLRIALGKIETVFNKKENGDKLTPIEAHDIMCHIADAVLAGGIRRAALISLFSLDDKEMATCKHGNWWELNAQRGRANNSAVILRNRVTKQDFDDIWQLTVDSNSGEPGVYFTNDPEYGTNPCCEIALRPNTFCNLTEINAAVVDSQETFNKLSQVAAFFGTLQAGFTDFHYLRNVWKSNTEKDALIGVGITGIANGTLDHLNLSEAADLVKIENERVAKLININLAARTTTVKPSGTTSCVVGTSSGIHAWHSKHYIRNMQCKVGDDLYQFFTEHHPKLIKVMDIDPNSAVIGIPQEAPETAVLRENETALDMLERVRKYNVEWVRRGHRRGPNTNNVSATVNVKRVYATDSKGQFIKDENNNLIVKIDEWPIVGQWMWNNKDTFNGLSALPYDGGTYKDAPFMEVSEEVFNDKMNYILNHPIDLTKIIEEDDYTDLQGELACISGQCDIV